MGLDFNTPVETYYLKGKPVDVKRDDLHNGDLDLPPWAKIEGVRQLLISELINKNKPVVHLAVRGYYTGWVLIYYGQKYGYDIRVSDEYKISREKAISVIKKLNWKDGFFRKDIGFKIIK